MRRVQGYGLDAFVASDDWNLSKLVIGSEGTLGTILECRLKLVPMPKSKVLCTVHFADLLEAIRTVSPILGHNPSAVEIMDDEIVRRARENLSIRPLTSFIEGNPKAILIVEFFGETQEEAVRKAQNLAKDLKKQKRGYSWPVITTPEEQAKVWAVRKHGLGLMLGIKGDRKPLPIVEDSAVPIQVLPEYVDKILKFCRERDIPVAMYAHASVGVIHVRPALNLKDRKDIEHMKALAEYAFGLVKGYGGSLSGEHGDGRVRSPFLKSFFGDRIYDAFRRTKNLFDPQGLMNPGIIIDPGPMDENLRYGTGYKTPKDPTVYHFRKDGSFAAAVEMCTGVGDCRQQLAGIMCPSYRATYEEALSTRGYANALRLAMTGQFGPDMMTDNDLFELLDHCLSCKACKSECPSNVDLTRLKAEFLNGFFSGKKIPARAQVLLNMLQKAETRSGRSASFHNFLHRAWPMRLISAMISGRDPKRRVPRYVRVPFDQFAENGASKEDPARVALFIDCFTKYYRPDIGRSAVELLESCGYKAVFAGAGCCQRPKIDAGLLAEAKQEGEKTLRALDGYVQEGVPVIALEPGCWSALVDDLPDLVDDESLGNRIKKNVMMMDEFLAGEIKKGRLTCGFSSPYNSIGIHVHSHRQALTGGDSMKYVLEQIPGVYVELLDAGSCGNVGFYGYAKGHRDLSVRIGEERLFPVVRKSQPETTIVACGFECRAQIADVTGVPAVHWVETLRGAVKRKVSGVEE
jgi:Fe-S oxidoreductase